jgi:hypothetical protein
VVELAEPIHDLLVEAFPVDAIDPSSQGYALVDSTLGLGRDQRDRKNSSSWPVSAIAST